MTDMVTQELQGAQVSFLFASQLLYLEPNEDSVTHYIEQKMFVEAPFGMGNKHVQAGLIKMQSWCDMTIEQGKDGFAENLQALKNDWFALFVGAGVPKAPSWESFYRETNKSLFSKRTLEVRAWYQKYGLAAEKEHKEPDDNLGLMLGFMGKLLELELAAQSEPTAEPMHLAEEQQDFLAEHILPWLAAWRYNIVKYAATDYYSGLGELVFGLCEEYAKRFAIIYKDENESFVRTSA